MNQEKKKRLLNRMGRLIGHAESNKTMIKDDRYCIDVIHQNLAVIEALHKVNGIVLEDHLQSCVTSALRGRDTRKQQKVIQEILEINKATKR